MMLFLLSKKRNEIWLIQRLFVSLLFTGTFLINNVAAVASSNTVGESIFLKEIITGRCYYNPPSGDGKVDTCPVIIGSIMGVIESHLESDITTDSFTSYYNMADFKTNKDHAIFILPTTTSSSTSTSTAPIITVDNTKWKTVESTPGGALLNDLIFCGVDKRQDCTLDLGTTTGTTGSTSAQGAFWDGAYAAYAKHVTGDVHAIILQDAILSPFITGAIPNLDASSISSFSIITSYACDGSSDVITQIMDGLRNDAGISSDIISCTNSSTVLLTMDQLDNHQNSPAGGDDAKECDCSTTAAPSSSAAATSIPSDGTTKTKSGGGLYKFLFWILLILFVGLSVWVHKKEVLTRLGTSATNTVLGADATPSEQLPLNQPKQ